MRNTVRHLCIFLMVVMLQLYASAASVRLSVQSGSGRVSVSSSSHVVVGQRPKALYPSARLILLILRERCQQFKDSGVTPLPSFCFVLQNQQSQQLTADLHRMYDSYRQEQASSVRTTSSASLQPENQRSS